jgi:hypothetical protein
MWGFSPKYYYLYKNKSTFKMKFQTPCFVRVEDAKERKELAEWLKHIGYKVCRCCEFDGWNTITCGRVERKAITYEAHGVPDCDVESGYNINLFKVDNAMKENQKYDCENDIELFKALAAMNDQNDREQWFVVHEMKELFLCRLNCMKEYDSHRLVKYRKATAEEIINKFRNK